MKKTLRNVITSVLSASVLMSLAPGALAAVDAPGTYTDVIYENDGASSAIIGNGCMTNVDTGDARHGKADVINATDSLKYAEKWLTIDSGKDYVLSFDFKTTANDHPFVFLLKDTNDKDFAHFGVDSYGKAVIANTGWSLWDLTGNYDGQYRVGFDYTANKWHTVDAVFHPNGEDTTIDWYFDGEFKVTANTTGDTKQHLKGETGILRTIYVKSTKTGENCGGTLKEGVTWNDSKVMYVDNMRVSYLDTYTGYYAKAAYSNGEAVITFNETPAGNLTGAVVKDTAGNVVSSGTAVQEGRKLYVPVQSSNLIAGKEYTVVMPSVKSITGKSLASAAVFTAPAAESTTIDPAKIVPQATLPRMIKNFESGAISGRDAASANIYFNGRSAVVAESEAITGSTSTNKVLKLTQSNKGDVYRIENGWFAWDQTVSPVTQNYELVELDVYQDAAKPFRTGDIKLFSTGSVIACCFFDKDGKFVYVTHGDGWSNESTGTGKSGLYTTANAMTTGWHNIKMLHDKVNAKVHYYLDNQYIGNAITKEDTKNVTFENRTLKRIDISTNEANLSENAMLVDNIKMSYLDTVMPNGTVVANKADSVTVEAGGSAEILPQSNPTIKAGRDYIFSADIQISNPASNAVGIYVRNSENNMVLSSKLDMTNTLAFLKNDVAWLDDAETNNNGYFHAFDAFADTTKAHNLTVYCDASAETLSVYVDKQYITTVSRSATGGIVPNQLYVGVTANTESTATISNLKVIEVPGPTAVKARLKTADDEYCTNSSDIPAVINSIDVYYSEAIDMTAAPTATLKNAEGAEITLGTATFDTETNKLSYPVPAALANGTYTMEIKNAVTTSGAVVDDTTLSFTVNGKVTVQELKYVNDSDVVITSPSAGQPIYVAATIKNGTAESKKAFVILAGYDGGRLADVKFKEVTVSAGATATVGITDSVTMTHKEGRTYKAMVWDGFDTGVPYSGAAGL